VPVGTAGVVYVGSAVPFVIGVTGCAVSLADCAFALTARMTNRRKNNSALVKRDEDVEAAIANWFVVIKGRYGCGRWYRGVATRGKQSDIT
jgi:hypothetical protein